MTENRIETDNYSVIMKIDWIGKCDKFWFKRVKRSVCMETKGRKTLDNISICVEFHCGSLMAKTFQNSKVSPEPRLPSKDLGQTSPFTVIRSQFRMLSISFSFWVSTNIDNRALSRA